MPDFTRQFPDPEAAVELERSSADFLAVFLFLFGRMTLIAAASREVLMCAA